MAPMWGVSRPPQSLMLPPERVVRVSPPASCLSSPAHRTVRIDQGMGWCLAEFGFALDGLVCPSALGNVAETLETR
ncbi:MAG: hypothetical protein RLZZ450_6416 [Pseudomonadota bacterium]|jgi:hypothetical protein